MAEPQSGEGARNPRQDGHAHSWKGSGRRHVERRSVQRLFAASDGVDRRRGNVRHERSEEAAGQRLRARPARRRRREMIRRVFAALLLTAAAPIAAQTIAITGGTVALGDGSEPIPNGMVVIQDGKVVAAGNVRMKLPAD